MKLIPSDIDFLSFLGEQESQYLIKPSDLEDGVLARMRGGQEVIGDTMPWNKTKQKFRYRPGEVTILGAYNGHKKSMIMNQICAWNLRAKNWLVASMEMKPDATMHRMTQQVIADSEDRVKKFLKWTDNRLWIYDQVDTVPANRILGMIHYAAQELNINHVIIDSLMKCGFKGDKNSISLQQVDFVDRICWAAKSYNIHIHLIHHMRKGEGNQGEYKRPGKHDFRGAGDLVDLVDNALILHQNKSKAKKIEKGEDVDQREPDATLEVCKQRHGEWEGTFNLWFDAGSIQHIPEPERGPMPYLSD